MVVMEAMKMEHSITAPADATVKSVQVSTDQNVPANEDLIILE